MLLGMTMEEVRAVMGEPFAFDEVTADPHDQTLWIFVQERNVWLDKEVPDWLVEPGVVVFDVRFEQGRVVHVSHTWGGRAGDSLHE